MFMWETNYRYLSTVTLKTIYVFDFMYSLSCEQLGEIFCRNLSCQKNSALLENTADTESLVRNVCVQGRGEAEVVHVLASPLSGVLGDNFFIATMERNCLDARELTSEAAKYLLLITGSP